jgi:hypothetical protein
MTDTDTAPGRTTATDTPAYQWYVGGQWRDAPDSNLFDDFEPYTGNLFARAPDCGPEEARIVFPRHDLAISCRGHIQASPELTDSERTAILGGTAATLIPRLATLRLTTHHGEGR